MLRSGSAGRTPSCERRQAESGRRAAGRTRPSRASEDGPHRQRRPPPPPFQERQSVRGTGGHGGGERVAPSPPPPPPQSPPQLLLQQWPAGTEQEGATSCALGLLASRQPASSWSRGAAQRRPPLRRPTSQLRSLGRAQHPPRPCSWGAWGARARTAWPQPGRLGSVRKWRRPPTQPPASPSRRQAGLRKKRLVPPPRCRAPLRVSESTFGRAFESEPLSESGPAQAHDRVDQRMRPCGDREPGARLHCPENAASWPTIGQARAGGGVGERAAPGGALGDRQAAAATGRNNRGPEPGPRPAPSRAAQQTACAPTGEREEPAKPTPGVQSPRSEETLGGKSPGTRDGALLDRRVVIEAWQGDGPARLRPQRPRHSSSSTRCACSQQGGQRRAVRARSQQAEVGEGSGRQAARCLGQFSHGNASLACQTALTTPETLRHSRPCLLRPSMNAMCSKVVHRPAAMREAGEADRCVEAPATAATRAGSRARQRGAHPCSRGRTASCRSPPLQEGQPPPPLGEGGG